MHKITCLFIVLLFLMPVLSSAATYYVDATGGNDNNDGLSPSTAWKTVTKVNNEIAPGGRIQTSDDILFKRGETFRDLYLGIRKGGTASDPLVIGAYGTGAKPIITHPGGGIYADTPSLAYITIQDLEIRDAALAAG